jgi:putative membrane protein insertion efficiency factor
MTKRILLAFLGFYRYWVSPVVHVLSPQGCKFQPTCSQYASEAIAIHGPRRGGGMAIGRLARCHPFTQGGFDPVPLPIETIAGSSRPSRSRIDSPDQIDPPGGGRLTVTVLRDPLP